MREKMGGKFALAALLLLLLSAYSSAQAQTVEQKIETMRDRIWNQEMPLVTVLMLTALFIIALAYMASQAFQKREWETWARSAGFQLGFSFAVLVGINLLLLSCSWLSYQLTMNPATNDPGQDLYVASGSYLNRLVSYNGFVLVGTLTGESIQNQLEAINFKFTSTPWAGGHGSAKDAGEKTKANAQDTLTNMLMPMIASLYAQQVILQAVADFAIPLALPLAFILRLFPQTRGSADQLLAIVVGFAGILPLTYVLNMHIAASINPSDILAPLAKADVDLHLGQLAPLISQAVFLPNLTIVLTVSFIMAFSKLLTRGFEPEVPYGEQ